MKTERSTIASNLHKNMPTISEKVGKTLVALSGISVKIRKQWHILSL